MISFTVPGVPAPQGSLTRTSYGVRQSNPQTMPWRNAVAAAALEASNGGELYAGPVRLEATFVFARPRGHYRTGRHAGLLKPSAPLWRTQAPDLDKLLRAVCDALTGVVVVDDAQIVETTARKCYGGPNFVPGAWIIIEPINLGEPGL
jgi:Holliday junction resolvase RusA-like endonuclease